MRGPEGTEAGGVASGRKVEAAYLVKRAGEGLWAPFAPSELSYEGIALRGAS